MFKTATGFLLLLPLLSCGGPVDEFWKGSWSDCTLDGTSMDTGDEKPVMILEGPVTGMPKGDWGSEDKYGNVALRPFTSATYIGPLLSITVDTKTSGDSYTMEASLLRTPVSFTGDVTYKFLGHTEKCKITLNPDP